MPLPLPQPRPDGLRNFAELQQSMRQRFKLEPLADSVVISKSPSLFETTITIKLNEKEYRSKGISSNKKISICAATARWYELYEIDGMEIRLKVSNADDWKEPLRYTPVKQAPQPRPEQPKKEKLPKQQQQAKEEDSPISALYQLAIRMNDATPEFKFQEVLSAQQFICSVKVKSPFSQRCFIAAQKVGNCKAQAKMLATIPVLEELKRHFALYDKSILLTEDLFAKLANDLVKFDDSIEEQEIYDIDEKKSTISRMHETLSLLFPGEIAGRRIREIPPTEKVKTITFEATITMRSFEAKGTGIRSSLALDTAAKNMLDLLHTHGLYPLKSKFNERFNLLPIPVRGMLYRKLFTKAFRLKKEHMEHMLDRGLPAHIIRKVMMTSYYSNQKLPEPLDARLPGISMDGEKTVGPSGIAIPCFDYRGENATGAQIRVNFEGSGKYMWLSSTKFGGCPPHLDTNDVPLYFWNIDWLGRNQEVPHFDKPIYKQMRAILAKHKHCVGICEGGIKSLIASLRLQLSFVGFANCFNVSKEILRQALEYFLPSKDDLIVWFPDHAFDKNEGVCLTYFRSIDTLFQMGYKNIQFMYWEQCESNDDGEDIDDLHTIKVTKDPKSFVRLISIQELLKTIDQGIAAKLSLKRWMGIERMEKYKKETNTP